ncbi:MAG: tetratricopeptide repeat protein [Phycisphaerae bacterium]|nr:tetratricopeptide repeat protein [Phycisphaerae bacterium]
MATITGSEVDLFGSNLPDTDTIQKLGAWVNSGESNRVAFEKKVKENLSNSLAAGIGLYLLGKYRDAIPLLEKGRDCKEKLLYLALAYRRLKRFDEAIGCLDGAAKQGADSRKVTLEKAGTYVQAGRLDDARKELKSCANFEKVSAEYHYQLGRLADAEGEYANALKNYRTAVELDSQHTEAVFQLAYACDLRGDEEAAIDYYRQVLKRVPAHVNALLNLAVIYEDNGQYEKAATCVDTVLKVHPNHAKALLFSKDIESSMVMIYDEEKERRKDKRAKILEIPITDFELSVRSRNCLKKMNLLTLGDLLKVTEAELLSYKNFGETSLVEIKQILDSKGLSLGMALEDAGAAVGSESATVQGASEDLLRKTVEEMELSVRSRRALTRLGVKTILDLIQKTEAELLGCKNFGVTSLNEIKDRLTSYGLSLRKLE